MTLHPSKLSLTACEALGFTDAACLYDPELHTGPQDATESPEEKAARLLVAAEVCLACPLLGRCLDRAVAGSPEPGVWGTFDAETLRTLFSEHIDTETITRVGAV
ncbi:WhiB family transcriptional regulator [Spirillospora sp. NPDC000708]